MYGNDYGGGFMANSSPRTSSQNSPGGERRAASQSLRPVTIKQVLKADQAHSDAELYIDRTEVAQITVVAQVILVANQATNNVYHIDDGTGRIEARVWTDGSGDENQTDDHDGVSPGSYVRVTGVLKHFQNKRYINASNIRPIKDAHELYFHLEEVMYVTLQLRNDQLSNSDKAEDANGSFAASTTLGGGTSANYSNYTSHPTATKSDQYPGSTPLQRRITQFIATITADEGVHVAKIAREMKVDAELVSAALEDLLNDGHVYTTINESHVKLA
ncbi:replication protein A, subunit RPA32 [Fomitiporia mediterranea MF3/22]|uniref:replication protein A, subunit RPA32 n=1 Tax=Fomitiporia mediterranea (strain MF3/22) TaxID=694068 RepID=UPI0004408124|nr:replication protein A, subunit RPA32 [Fomitiporia mediterranea MF3/22]EJD02488.1 replication protein A, subunit RPA32 [Fomitiporia mediterranea MF3/22]